MKKAVVITIILFTIIGLTYFLLFSKPKSIAEVSEEQLTALSYSFMKEYNDSAISNLTQLFHYPPNYPIEKFSADSSEIHRILNNMRSIWGKATTLTNSILPESQMHLGLSTSDKFYWFTIKEYQEQYLKVSFDKHSEAVIEFKYCLITDEPELCKLSIMNYVNPKLDTLQREAAVDSVVNDLTVLLNTGKDWRKKL